MAESKVLFNLHNVYYAVLTEGSANSWGTPVAVPGAVSLSLSQEGSSNDFYADGVTYYKTVVNNGYTGTLEMAKIPDAMLSAVWGFDTNQTDNIQYEYSNVEVKPFALMFQIDGDSDGENYCFYRCVAERPELKAQTSEDAKTPQTASFEFSALPLVTGAENQKYLVKAKTTATTPAATRSGWFSSVPVPATTSND